MPAPDLKAPRFRRRHQGTVNKISLAQLRAQVPDVAHFCDERLEALLHAITKTAREQVIALPAGVELPGQLGHLFIGACPGLFAKRVDYKSSQELGRKVQHRNWESDGYQAKIFYQNMRHPLVDPGNANRYQFRHRELWAFKGCRLFTRAVGQSFPQLWRQYAQVESNRKNKALNFKLEQQFDRQLTNQEYLTTYDEFDI